LKLNKPAVIDLLIYDSVQVFISRLESFGDAFARLATTSDQRRLAEEFREFVQTTEPAVLGKAAVPSIVRDYQKCAPRTPDMDLEI
jgi:hypothetical protein